MNLGDAANISCLRKQESVANRGNSAVARKVSLIDWRGLAVTTGHGLQQTSQEDSSSGNHLRTRGNGLDPGRPELRAKSEPLFYCFTASKARASQ